MSVLSNVDLKRILTQDEGIIILRRREANITGVGYDLTIGFIRDAVTGKTPETFIDKDNVTRYTLLAGHRYLVISKEFLYLSPQYMATLHSRGSYALKGIIVTSTTVDPNYAGCITGSLFNCSPDDIHIKKENQFATMVFHKLCTPTNTYLQINERGNPKDTQETFHGRYPNIHPDACDAGDAYYGHVRKALEPEFIDALKRMYQKIKLNTESNEQTHVSEEKTAKTETPPKNASEDSVQKSKKIMKVTFLIGNGFDLSVGLNTSYKAFFTHYINNYPDDLLAEQINRDMDNWSDLELALGRFTGKISPITKDKFWDSEYNLENALAEYLQKETERIHLENTEISEKTENEMYRFLTGFYKKNQDEDIESLKRILEDASNVIEYSFITFNYTDTLEQCLNTLGKRVPSFASLPIASYKNQKALHIHGSIRDNTMVLGVNDENQIANADFREPDSKERLIKSDINESYGNTRKQDAQAVIENSSIICVFGMSLGETDQIWWQSIANWLRQDLSRELVIFSKKEGEFLVKKHTLQQERNIRNKFFDNGNIPVDVRRQIEKQIHVVINADLFHIRLV